MDIVFVLKKPFFLAMPLQVKSSTRALKKHYKKYPDILAIAVLPFQTPEKISRNIEKTIIIFLKRAPALLEKLENRKI